MTPEGKVKAEIKAFLDNIGAWYFMPSMMGYGRKGIPDIVGCFDRKFFAIEVKAPGKENTVTAWQTKELNAIRAANGLALVVSNANAFKNIFESWIRAL